ncbi:solute carrier organic anion transporter family member 4A1-like isoform X1 [Ornithodoros turicata]|uniref:solute carrier organic anion transporter family member 4A1-like isoform X1 n=4 Tax=Ornithodoros turicata TaxID=34597 RepID=UPI003138E949
MWTPDPYVKSDFSVSSFGITLPHVRVPPRKYGGGGLVGVGHDVYCGLCGFYPSWMQGLRTPRCYLVFLCILGMTQGFVVNGLVSVVTPTLEKRFQLRGIEVGIIQSMFNIASCIMMVPVSYIGGVQHKPAIIGVGAIILSAGSMLFSLPHFVAPRYRVEKADSASVCPNPLQDICKRNIGGLNWFKYFFMVGHALHGVGSSPFFTLGVAYLDENTPTQKSSLYMGIFYATSVLGPALGFILGGYFLSLYTDATADASELGMSKVSIGWVGRWWLGFFIASIVALGIAGPMASFPKELPGKQEREQQIKANKEPAEGQPVIDRSFLSFLKRLLTNKTFVCLTFAACAETFIASGLTGFATKIFISMFGVSSSVASGLLGAVSVPSACGGTLLGGYIVTKLTVKSSTIARYCVILSFVTWFTIFVFMHSCPNINYAAGNTTVADMWLQTGREPMRVRELVQPCNQHCNCTGYKFDPVCGTDNFTFFSPCIAGCASAKQVNDTQIYMQCSCITGPILQLGDHNDTALQYQAIRDPCASHCSLVIIFCISIFIALFCTFLLIVPALTAMLRTLDEDLKSTGIGVNYVAIRLFGTIPGPILFGYLIDKSCILWQDTCEGQGACAIYENGLMGMNIFRLMILVKTASIFFFFCSALAIKDPPGEDQLGQGQKGHEGDTKASPLPSPLASPETAKPEGGEIVGKGNIANKALRGPSKSKDRKTAVDE